MTYNLTIWDWATFLGLFFALIFIFVRFLLAISIFEMWTLVPAQEKKK